MIFIKTLYDTNLHFFSMFNRQYAFDYNTNFVFSVDDLSAKILDNRLSEIDKSKYDKKLIDKRNKFIKLLCDKGIISTKKQDNELYKQKFHLSTITLFLTNNCNLRCKYCYEGDQHKVKNMSKEVATASIDFLLNNLDANICPSISLFGGEPLLNVGLIEYIHSYINKHKGAYNCKYSLTTNGTIMNDDIYVLLRDLDIKVMLSLDGSKEKQDSNRKFENGFGSYEKIKSNVEHYLEPILPSIVIRNTITKSDIDYKNTYDFFKNSGYKKLISIPISTNREEEKLNNDDINKLIDNCKMIAEDVLNDLLNNKDILKANFFNFGQLYNNNMGNTYCGAGIRSIAIDTNGDVYNCHRFVGNNQYMLGNVMDGIKIDKVLEMQNYYSNRFNKLHDCKGCWAFNLCKGGCMHENLMESNTISKPNLVLCNLRRAWFEITIALYAIICEMEPTLIEKIYGEDVFNYYMNKWIPLNIN